MTKGVRVRIAPSPTGDPHVGFAFTSLCNYLFAKQNNGKLLFRLEDTDQQRFRQRSEENLLSALRWLEIDCDEFHRQSERLPLYHSYLESLLSAGHAYKCYCSTERLARIREEQRARKLIAKYDRHCRNKQVTNTQTPHVVRLKMPIDGHSVFHDALRGEISIDNQQLDDQILLKSDGFPTYHLASVIDDHEMHISHVIRAEEWLSSTPKHTHLYRMLDLPLPKFVHLPILRNADGSKISKRKNPLSIQLFKRLGILPSALTNYLALIGGGVRLDKEIFARKEMIANFSLTSISLGDPAFDWQKLLWLNQKYIMALQEQDFCAFISKDLLNTETLRKLFPLYKSRLTHLAEFLPRAQFFFAGSLSYEHLAITPSSRSQEEFLQVLATLKTAFASLEDWTKENIKAQLQTVLQQYGWRTKELYMPVRLLTTGTASSPDLVPTLELLGRELVVFRLQDYLLREG